MKKKSVQRGSGDAKVPECTKALIPSTPSGIAKACRMSARMLGSAEPGHYTQGGWSLWKSVTFRVNAIETIGALKIVEL